MNSLPLVGLSGKKRSGKDTFAAAMQPAGFERVAFADPLRAAALQENPIVGTGASGRYVYLADVVEDRGWEWAKDAFPEVRRTLQLLGQAIRTLDPDFWLNLALKQIDSRDTPVVVTDVRFPNEADAIHARGGIMVRLNRPDQENADQDVSETALDDYPLFDVTVVNNSTIDQFRVIAKALGVRWAQPYWNIQH